VLFGKDEKVLWSAPRADVLVPLQSSQAGGKRKIMDAELQKMHRSHHRRRVAEMRLFLMLDLPVLLEAEPPKTEPVTKASPELKILNPYVPLARQK
jgi:hypothetical protein